MSAPCPSAGDGHGQNHLNWQRCPYTESGHRWLVYDIGELELDPAFAPWHIQSGYNTLEYMNNLEVASLTGSPPCTISHLLLPL